MRKGKNGNTEEGVVIETAKPLRANVSFDLTAEELEQLIEMCAEDGLFRLGIRLAERKSRLLSNLSRMAKELQAMEETPA